MKINPYLNFNGNCAEAFRFYEKCFGGKIDGLMRFGDAPGSESVPPQFHDNIMHAELKIGDQTLMGSDGAPGCPYDAPKGLFVTLVIDAPAEAERIYHALVERGTVTMELQETFWADRFACVVDRFGIPWMINCQGSKVHA